jgi:AraC-like DNA-binding protein
MPAFLETVLHFDFGDPLTVVSVDGVPESARPLEIVGPHLRAASSLRFDGEIDNFAVFLQPAALWSLFHVPSSEVVEAHPDAVDVIGRSVGDLWHVLAETTTFTERVLVAENYLARFAGEATADWRRSFPASAATLLVRSGGRIGISDLASQMHVGVRQLERRFLREMGTSPKRFARVARFQAALDARVRRPERSWLDIAVAAGYHDQMHLVHDFRALAGYAPQFTVSQLGDSRPPALAVSHDIDGPVSPSPGTISLA